MRKQDRIAHERQNRPLEPGKNEPRPLPKEGERIKGSASEGPKRPEREGGKLPLPD